MTGRPIYIAYPSAQGSKLTLSREKSAIADNLTQYPDRDGMKNIYFGKFRGIFK